jgi:small nuclear ribonucleoprotein (snRNP)-like protein
VVLLPNGERCEGKLEHYSLHYNVALVRVKNYTVDRPVDLNDEKIHYCARVVAVGRCFESGLAMAASGEFTGWSGKLDCKDLLYTACTITKVVPLIFC